jgi:cyclopropane fatty-acyl-phospholipid synthase-like methyltransferase
VQPLRQRQPREDRRLVELVSMLSRADLTCEVALPWRGQTIVVGEKELQFRLRLCNERLLHGPITELALGQAYVQGDIDIEIKGGGAARDENRMAIFRLRDRARPGVRPREALRLGREIALTRPTQANERAIREHYSYGDDFYLVFLDRRYRFYSQCMFDPPSLVLEAAAERKLEHMWASLGLKPGDRILDVGAGWGGLMQYCSPRGVHVTSLTLSEDSERYLLKLMRDRKLDGEVIREDFLEHRRSAYYDHVVIFGVIEHIPTYGTFCRRAWDAIKPGGRLYLDASATTEKYAGSPFIRRYIWHGPHSCLALQDMTEELLFHGFEVESVRNGNADYERTMRAWAARLEAHRTHVVARWGQHRFRTFQVFLWGGADAMRTNRLQAYTLVARRREDKGPRPGRLRRTGHFLLRQRD